MKTKNIITVLLLTLAVSFSSCEEKESVKLGALSFTCIAQQNIGSRYEKGVRENIIIRNQRGWENLKMSMCESVIFNETEIDFRNYQIMAVFDEERPDFLWSISVMSITEYSDKIVVDITVESHSICFSLPAISRPFHVVKLPASRKRIEFRDGYKFNNQDCD